MVQAAGCAPAPRTRERPTSERLIRERLIRERLVPGPRVLDGSARFPPVPVRRARALAPVSPTGTETRPALARGQAPARLARVRVPARLARLARLASARVPTRLARLASAPTLTGRPVLA